MANAKKEKVLRKMARLAMENSNGTQYTRYEEPGTHPVTSQNPLTGKNFPAPVTNPIHLKENCFKGHVKWLKKRLDKIERGRE